MAGIFLKIVNMSISACWIILAIVLLRVVLKKAPKWINCILWGIAGLRLIMPLSFESIFSLIPSAETITKVPDSPRPHIDSGVSIIDNQVNDYLQGNYFEGVSRPMGNFVDITTILAVVWVVGIIALLIYTLVSFLRLKSKIGTAVLLRDNIYQSESVVSPFVLGTIKPKIYLPFNMSEQDMEHVIAHEQAHIRRKDHLWKPLGFLILILHCFNPMVWIGYILLCRDIELACDEKVVKELNNEQRADYSQALLTCSVNRRMIAACPIAFGEVGVKDRVKSVLNYKKPAFWIIIVAIVVSIITAICFLTDPLDKGFSIKPESNVDIYEIEKHYYDKVVGADIANESDGYFDIAITKDMVIYKYFKAQGGTIDNSWIDIGKLVKQEDIAVIEALIKDNIPVKYKFWGIKEFYVALDESEIQSASCIILMKNGDVLLAEVPGYKTENRYVSNLMKLKIKKSETQNGSYKLSKEIYFDGAFSYVPNIENDRIEIKTEVGMHIYHFTGEVLSTGALYEEVRLDKENFSNLFGGIPEWSDYKSLNDLLKNNKKAWHHNTPDDIGGYPYILLLQKDGTFCMVFADFENGEPTKVRYIYELEYTGNIENGFNNVDNISTEYYDLGYSLQVVAETYKGTTQFPESTETYTFDIRNGTKGNLPNGANFEITECDLQTGKLTIKLSGTPLYSTKQVEPASLNEIVVELGSDGAVLSDENNMQFFTFVFVEAQSLDKAVSQAIIDDNYVAYYGLGTECATEGHIIYGTDIDGDKYTVYALTDYANFGFMNGYFVEQSGGSGPAVLTFEKTSSGYKLLDIQYPQDGEGYGESIKELFPKKYQYRVMHPTSWDYNNLWKQKVSYAQAYLDEIGRTEEIRTYSQVEHTLFTDIGVSVEVSNKIVEYNLPYNFDVGYFESVEDGVRYIYRTTYEKKQNIIIYTKENYETKEVVEKIEIDSLTGEIITSTSLPEETV